MFVTSLETQISKSFLEDDNHVNAIISRLTWVVWPAYLIEFPPISKSCTIVFFIELNLWCSQFSSIKKIEQTDDEPWKSSTKETYEICTSIIVREFKKLDFCSQRSKYMVQKVLARFSGDIQRETLVISHAFIKFY